MILFLIPLLQYTLFIIFSEIILDALCYLIVNIIGISIALIVFYCPTFFLCCLSTSYCFRKDDKKEKYLTGKELVKIFMCILWIIFIKLIIEYIFKMDLIIINHSYLSDLTRWNGSMFYVTGILLSFKLLFHLAKLIIVFVKNKRIRNCFNKIR